MEMSQIAFIWPWVGTLRLNMAKYGSWRAIWVVPGIVPLPTHPHPTTPGTPPHCRMVMGGLATLPHGSYGGRNIAVGLKSVEQLTLSPVFSGFQGFTEGYNLSKIGRINNHSFIPSTK